LAKAQEQQKRAYDRHHQEHKVLKEDDQVWLSSQDLSTDCPSPKLEALWYGPFRVKVIKGPLTYELDLLSHWQVHPVFHCLKLKKVHMATLSHKNPTPFPQVTVTNKRYKGQDINPPTQTSTSQPKAT
jgi:hypothetical protein